ncbi:hypothetical protein CPB84DRAFT_1780049 [Gymnopilus junonius]|uniref:Uncharacterized protein n=1 Tax=Gymnopilus junonius TaxID=109634 RepID=A0A9P5NMM1_GYMJU|nr:hypothetical protein CPB84DRAFT_1780049 [Gymnopilus junonius]
MILADSKIAESDSVPVFQVQVLPPPPSYVQEENVIHPLDKTPLVFPDREDHTIVLNNVNFSPSSSSTSYYATPSSPDPSSRPRSPQFGSLSPTLTRELSSSSSSSFYDPGSIPLPFSRVPPTELSYRPFKPIFLVARSKMLDKGFPPAPPPSDVQPHPFMSHDVSEGDWISFLAAVQDAASLTDKDIRRSRVPIMATLPILGHLSSIGIQQYMRHHKGDKVAKLVDMWNHHFFSLRKLRVILMKGKVKVSGQNDLTAHNDKLVLEPSNESPTTPDDDIYRLFVVSI